VTLQDWGAIGEFVGGVAIIISLIYVGVQIKQGTNATRAASNQAFNAQYYALLVELTRPDTRDVFWKGIGGLKNLKGSEQAAFMGFLAAIMRTYETFYFERLEGRFDSRMWDGYSAQLFDLYANVGVQEYWEIRKHQFSDEFCAFLNSQSTTVDSKPMYRTDS